MARIVIAAGGTAGHVVPALAVADELRARGAEVSFVGTRERVEAELVPAAGYDLSFIAIRGLDRSNPLRAARAALGAVPALGASLRLLGSARPDAVLGGGGYVAGPVGLAAALRRIPLVLSEADSRLGVANRLLAPFARRICLAFPIAGRDGDRYLVTGRPVPAAIAASERTGARERLGIDPGVRCLLVFGGSLGARSINFCALEAFAGGTEAVLHVAGRRDYPELSRRLDRLGRPVHYRLYEYFEGSLADPLAASDLVIARAGGSVFELAAAGKPAVLVPYPHAAAGHQEQNARWMVESGAALAIPDRELDPTRLAAIVRELLGDEDRLRAMAGAARRLARPDAAARVAEEVLAAAGAEVSAGPSPEPARPAEAPSERPWTGRRLHFVGIGGAGMSGLALVARQLGAEVSGCDRAESPYTKMLRAAGITLEIGHSAAHVEPGLELVVSTAIPEDVPDVTAAREQRLAISSRGSLLAEVTSLRRLIAVAGTHGKTTTAAMTAHCMVALGAEPSYLVGAELRAPKAQAAPNSRWGRGEWIIAEADESDRSFLELSPELAIVTNLELDHHTTYGSIVELEDDFTSFLARLPESGAAAVWKRAGLERLARDRRLVTYGIGEPADLVARDITNESGGTRFELVHSGRLVCDVELPVPGEHNVLNALAALSACGLAGFDLEQAARSLATFRAAARRFEWKGEGSGIEVFDDYAHHPTEVRATLEAARALGPRRLVAVFQPHLYSRTLRLHSELGRALAEADVVVVLDVYPAREKPEGELTGVSGKLVADASADHAGGRPVWWLPTLDEAEAVLASHLEEGDMVVTLGAGDVDQLAERLVERIRAGDAERDPARPPAGAAVPSDS